VTLILDRVIQHTVVHHSSTSIYMPNFVEIEETLCGRTYIRTDGHFETGFMRYLSKSQPKNGRISNFQRLVTLTLEKVILHTIVHHSMTSTYMPNLIEIDEKFCRGDGHFRRTLLGPKNSFKIQRQTIR